jgi:hypothetical protein
MFFSANLAACGKKAKPKVDVQNSQPKKPKEEMAIQVGASKSTRTDPSSGKTLWELNWKQSKFEMTNQGQEAEVEGVTGTGYGNGKPVSTFAADKAVIRRGSDVIELQGNVKVSSTMEQATMTANKVAFDPRSGMYNAEENVSLFHESIKMNVAKKLTAKFGHPMEGAKKMEKWILVGVVASGVMATSGIASSTQSRPTIVDRKSDPSIVISGDNIDAEPRVKFSLTGNISYRNLKNNTTILADSIAGTFKREEQNGKLVDTPNDLRLNGIKSIDLISKVEDVETITKITTAAINQTILDVTREKFFVPGKLRIERTNNVSKWNASGNSAEITVLRKPNKNESGLKELVLEGNIEIDGFRSIEKEVDKNGKSSKTKVKQNFTAKASKMLFTDFGNRQEIRASGNLDFTFAEDDEDASQMTGAKTLIIDLDSKGEVVKFRLSSDGPDKIRTIRPIGKKG